MEQAAEFTFVNRPKRFSDVFGQRIAVLYLSGIIKNHKPAKSVMLAGAIGSGKTTLARLYAKGLNCLDPLDDGSPCCSCSQCIKFNEILSPDGKYHRSSDFYEENGAKESGKIAIRTILDIARHPPMFGGKYKVIFIDEAQGIDRRAFDLLLKLLEEPPSHLVVIMATSDTAALPRSIRSRLIPLAIEQFTREESLLYLKSLNDVLELSISNEALDYLGCVTLPQPRDLAKRIEFISSFGATSLKEVIRLIGGSDVDFLLRYFRSLAQGDMAGIVETFRSWNEDAITKRKLVVEFLTFIDWTMIKNKADILINPGFSALNKYDLKCLLEDFSEYAKRNKIGLDDLWTGMQRFWWQSQASPSDISINLSFLQFHGLVSNIDELMGLTSPFLPKAPNNKLPAPVADNAAPKLPIPHGRRRARLQPALQVSDEATVSGHTSPRLYLDHADIRKLHRSATFMMQEYGVALNLTICISHSTLKRESNASTLMTNLVKALTRVMPTDKMAPLFHWLYVHDVNEELGLHTRLVAHVPAAYREHVRRRVFTWLEGQNLHVPTSATSVSFGRGKQSSREALVTRHWECLRFLMQGIHPAIEVRDEAGNRSRLVDILAIKEDLRGGSAQNLPERRVESSRSINESAQKRVVDEGMAILSAFDDWAWSRLTDGWEVDEYQCRQDERSRRQNTMSMLRLALNRDVSLDPSDISTKEANLKASWPIDPRARHRTWSIWPRHDEIDAT